MDDSRYLAVSHKRDDVHTIEYIRADRVELMVNELQREIDGLMYQLGEEQRKNTELHKECADLRFKLQHWEGK